MANRTPPQIEAIILELTLEYPAYGQTRIANQMRKLGHSVSPSGVRGVWQRHDLETMKKRLKALEAKVAQDGVVLIESQLAALEKAKLDKEAHGQFESECPGYCGGQDTFYVGNMKGSDASTSRPSSTPIRRSPSPSFMTARRRSPPPISSTTAWCRSSTPTT